MILLHLHAPYYHSLSKCYKNHKNYKIYSLYVIFLVAPSIYLNNYK